MESAPKKTWSVSEVIILLLVLVCTALILAEMIANLSGEVNILVKPTATQVVPTAISTHGPRPTLPPDYTPEAIHDS